LIVDEAPPFVKSAWTSRSPTVWAGVKPPDAVVEMPFLKNQKPVNASPLFEKRSRPK
jgi:hypothetical protein